MTTFTRMALHAGAALRAALSLTAAPAQAADPIKVGMSLALTGGGAPAGKMLQAAIELWRDDVNAKGGLLGRPVEIIVYDDQSNPANVPALYTKLITVDKADLLLGPYGTNFVAPAMPTIIQNNKMVISYTAIGINRQYNYEILLDGAGRAGRRERLLQRLLRDGGEAESEAADRGDHRRRRRIRPGRCQRRARRAEEARLRLSSTRAIRRARPTSRRSCARYRPPTPTSSMPAPIRPTASASCARPTNRARPQNVRRRDDRQAGDPDQSAARPDPNGLVIHESFVPSPKLKFPGLDDLMKRYQAKAAE